MMDGEREGRRARQREGRRDEGVHGTSGGRDEGIARGEARRSPTLARVPHLHEVPENQRDCTLAALELIGDCHLAPDEDQFGRALVDAEMLPHEVAALQKRRPVLNCKVLGAVFCFVKLERGHEDVVMLHHHVLHLLIVQPELTEVVGHDERLGRDSCNNLVLDESGHRIRRVVHDAGDDEFAKRRSHDALVKLKAHHFIVVVCVRLHGSTLLLEVDCNEDVGEVCRRAAAL
mmetsp:Transcript_41879/g.125363  ORF Transcript_41879/g.125363 Transcript_41879/m.125363 type:complete len:232 (+) Transcript_41879:1525-2220(+)